MSETSTFNPTAAPDFGAGVVITDANKFSGAGFLDSYTFLIKSCQDIQTADDSDKAALGVAIGLGAVASVVDTVKLVLNPLGSLISAGLGWLIEHVSFLREPLDMLMGDPDQIQLLSQEVHTIAASIRKIGEDQTASLTGDIAAWHGDAADAFTARMKELSADLDSKAHGTDVVGYLIQTNMAIIAAVRGLFRDLVTTVLGDIISTMLIALATAPFTFGASLVAGVTWCVTQATLTATSMASKLAAVIAQATRSAGRLGDLVKLLKTRPGASGAAGHGGGDIPLRPAPPTRPVPPPPAPTRPPPPTHPADDDVPPPPTRPADDVPAPPPARPGDDAPPPGRPADDDASSYHTAHEDTPPPSPRPSVDDAPPPGRPADDDASSYHTAHEDTPPPSPRPSVDESPPPSTHSGDDATPEPSPRPSGDGTPEPGPRPSGDSDAPAPPPAAPVPWTKNHETWLKEHQPDAWAKYKSEENWLKDNHPESFKLFKQWIADSDSAKEIWAWPIKGTQEVVKQLLDIQKTAATGWAADHNG
ncbi:hypothetical protein [Amycolatopsis sp. H20-H5]|uniref:hypothetical protein n=1 Tax=Amycolatopsis sp. H20-H5 TaxID=3046309 RepID=UPI002DBA1556|nr:hypothetical protein [Amycolatopsis sp. H20-H5]MEC3976154.1 hypothetical protein [Amycolatopsis sp. H20-H5]